MRDRGAYAGDIIHLIWLLGHTRSLSPGSLLLYLHDAAGQDMLERLQIR